MAVSFLRRTLVGLLLILPVFSNTYAFTNIQTATSFGVYRDYRKTAHYPFYHSWTLRGFYENGLETNLEFYLNNDFTLNEWTFYPTQAQFNIPLGSRLSEYPARRSQVQLGRQFFTEGFDLALLDGVQIPYYWSATGGIKPIAGYLRATDFEQTSDSDNALLGLVLWESFFDVQLRGGYTARDKDLSTHYSFASLLTQFSTLPLAPQIFHREEWDPDNMSFSQRSSELSLYFSDSVDARIAYSNLQPRLTNKKDLNNFVYSLFAISPTESVMSDISWRASEKVQFNLGGARSFYNSGYRDETADRADISVSYQLGHSSWLTPCAAYLKSYGGEVTDVCLRYTADASEKTRYTLEIDNAYLKKINQIEGWAQQARGSFETLFWGRTKALLALEVERNQYYVFDMRTVAYVTNYL